MTVNGYNQVVVDRAPIRGAVAAWAYVHGEWPGAQVDHINRDRRDDRIANLRLATQSQNIANQGARRDNSTGLRGVCFIAKEGRWRAMLQGKRGSKGRFLGMFDSPEAAHRAYLKAAKQRHGDFVCTTE